VSEQAVRQTAPTVAYLSPSLEGGQFDSRTWRMARSARDRGWQVVVYARWSDGLPFEDTHDGIPVRRIPVEPYLALPGFRALGKRRLARLRANAAWALEQTGTRTDQPADGAAQSAGQNERQPVLFGLFERAMRVARAVTRRIGNRALRIVDRVMRRAVWQSPLWLRSPIIWMAWSRGLEQIASPVDVWHGMWMASLPAVVRLRERMGGAAIYDSRDVFFRSRAWPREWRLPRAVLTGLERRWARACDEVLTVSDAYASMLTEDLGIPRPTVVMNCPERFEPPKPSPDLIRQCLGIAPTTAIVLYEGGLLTERGIEQAMDAIPTVQDAALVLMGYGFLRNQLVEAMEREPFRGRVFLLDPVPPSDLLLWVASADVMVMLYQPNTDNHLHVTPQKLFEALAAGVPVVASDLPGMRAIVEETGCGVLADPTSPDSIAKAIRTLLDQTPAEREAMRARCLAAAHARYNWESQVDALFGAYSRVIAGPAAGDGQAGAARPSTSS
jgi:glycosyltransferase involved in cell wall biosynthesis